jgi:hypothetical protein
MSSSINKTNKGENINNFLPEDCMLDVLKPSDTYPATLALVCKAWHQVLENSYRLIATFYRKDEDIAPFYSPVMTAERQIDAKETVKQTYLRIMEFIDAPHIKEALQQELGPQVVTPLTPSLGSILKVAREVNLVKSFENIFQCFTPYQNAEDYPHFQQAFASSCKATAIHPSAFKVGSDSSIRPSLASKVLCIRSFVRNSPEILNQKNLSIAISSGNITALPLEVCLFLNVTILNLSHNQLTTLPDAIGRLSKLTKLFLGNNKFTSFPEMICNLSELESLTIGNIDLIRDNHQNKLTDLPDTIGQLNKLTQLALHNNQFTHLPQGILNLPNLVFLNIKGNKINAIGLGAISKQLSQLPQFNIIAFEELHQIKHEEESTSPMQ